MGAGSATIRSTTQGGMYVRESGDPGSPAILFLHGVGNSGGMWENHMRHLGAFHCLAPDLPGFGRSNEMGWRSRSDTTERVIELIAARVPSRRTHVVGLSLGGSIVHELLATREGLLDRALIDGCAALPWWATSLIKTGVAALSPFLHTDFVVSTVGRIWGLDEASRQDMKAASRQAFRRGFADANDVRLSHAEIEASSPTLLVAGETEIRPPVRSSNAALAAMMPAAQARFLPGHAHGWLGAQPELHRRMTEAWISGTQLPTELRLETAAWNVSQVERLLRRAA